MFGPSYGVVNHWEVKAVWDLLLWSGVRERSDGSPCRNVHFAPALLEVFMPDADHDR